MTREELQGRWPREKYLLLERSPKTHQRLAAALEGEDPGAEGPDELMRLLEEGLAQAPSPESRYAAAQAVWSRLEEKAEGELANQARELLGRLAEDPWAIVYLKKVFKILASRQGWKSLLESSYLTD